MMKKTMALVIAALFALALAGCGGQASSPASSSAASSSEAVEDSGQNPLMNFVGPYACDRASIEIEARDANGAKVTVYWGSSAAETVRWEMEGTFDSNTLTIAYDNCVKTNVVFKEDGEAESEEIVYEDGAGTITFDDGAPIKLTWNDEKEHAADGMVFEFAA